MVVVVVVPVGEATGEDDESLDAAAAAAALTISCLVSDDRVPGPGFVRLIFILSPGSTVAE